MLLWGKLYKSFFSHSLTLSLSLSHTLSLYFLSSFLSLTPSIYHSIFLSWQVLSHSLFLKFSACFFISLTCWFFDEFSNSFFLHYRKNIAASWHQSVSKKKNASKLMSKNVVELIIRTFKEYFQRSTLMLISFTGIRSVDLWIGWWDPRFSLEKLKLAKLNSSWSRGCGFDSSLLLSIHTLLNQWSFLHQGLSWNRSKKDTCKTGSDERRRG